MTSNGDDHLRHSPAGLSMSLTERRGRVRLSLSPAEERRRTKALERKERMLTEDIRIAGALLERSMRECCRAIYPPCPAGTEGSQGRLQAWTGPMAWLAPKSPW